MKRFAEIKDGVVVRVIVADSIEWCEKILGGKWVETIKHDKGLVFAGKNYKYNKDTKEFVNPKIEEYKDIAKLVS